VFYKEKQVFWGLQNNPSLGGCTKKLASVSAKCDAVILANPASRS
jgi:hypothetical protein